MIKPIYASLEHEIIVNEYIKLMLSFAEEISSESKYKDFLDIVNIIIDYHNRYGDDMIAANWNDWLAVMPINLSVCSKGFFAGLKTKRNTESLKTYNMLLDKYLSDLILDLGELKFNNE